MSQHLSDLSDSSKTVQQEEASALQSALDRLQQGDFQTRWDVAKTVPSFGAVAIAPLLTILEEEETDWELLWFVARILGNLNDPSVIAALVNLLRTAENTEVASMAAMSLANYGTAAVAPLTQLLQPDSTRLLAVQALVQIRHADVVAPLLSVISDENAVIRSAAIEALSHFYDPAISTALLTALNDLNPTVRKAAVAGLGMQAQQSHQPQLTAQLQQRLWDFHPEVCSQAALALGRVGTDAAADALFELLQSPHTPPVLQVEAVRSLSWMDTVYALDKLRELLPSGSAALQQEILTVLGRVDSAEAKQKAAEMLLELLRSDNLLTEDPRSKQTIALSLGQLGQLAALDALISLLSDTNVSVRLHAIAALKQLDAETAYQRLQELAAAATIEPLLQVGVTIALQEW